jgi:hypothetical protein
MPKSFLALCRWWTRSSKQLVPQPFTVHRNGVTPVRSYAVFMQRLLTIQSWPHIRKGINPARHSQRSRATNSIERSRQQRSHRDAALYIDRKERSDRRRERSNPWLPSNMVKVYKVYRDDAFRQPTWRS